MVLPLTCVHCTVTGKTTLNVGGIIEPSILVDSFERRLRVLYHIQTTLQLIKIFVVRGSIAQGVVLLVSLK